MSQAVVQQDSESSLCLADASGSAKMKAVAETLARQFATVAKALLFWRSLVCRSPAVFFFLYYTYIYVHTHIYIYICMYRYVYIHMYIYIHVYMSMIIPYMYIFSNLWSTGENCIQVRFNHVIIWTKNFGTQLSKWQFGSVPNDPKQLGCYRVFLLPSGYLT